MAELRNRIYIIGAGNTGETIAAEIRRKGVYGSVVAFLDDDASKVGFALDGIPVLGPIEAVIQLLRSTPADEAIIALPSAPTSEIRRIYELLRRAMFARIRIVPGISQVLEERPHLVQAREIAPEDLLKRTPRTVSLRETLRYVKGKRVLITGAGGSIGSELSRQLLSGGAERLYLMGHGENSIYQIHQELQVLQDAGVGVPGALVPIVGELQDRVYVEHIVTRLGADVVFHAAAHKHVPLTEANPVEAVKNNVFGTQNIVDACLSAGVGRLVLISTDKAVDPICVYGASKLLAEEVVLHQASAGHDFLVVRFGNVLASRGSFMPLFRRQIANGGPVTVTHRAARRYLMTIPEAASLVLKAAGAGAGGELYLLDMGEPQSILELAEDMIRFYGYRPYDDIPIQFVGLRPGDKLVERLWRDGEEPQPTDNPGILSLRRSYSLNGHLAPLLHRLQMVCYGSPECQGSYRNRRALRTLLHEAVPTLEVPIAEPEY